MASRLQGIDNRLDANASTSRLEDIEIIVEAIAIGLEAIASRLKAITTRWSYISLYLIHWPSRVDWRPSLVGGVKACIMFIAHP